ncbi:MAG: sugar ABC transporter permease [Clostridia bacterium]|nr:sugar ABC transporter permease [Clostridia bacterium]
MIGQQPYSRSRWRRYLAPYKRNWDLYLLLIPAIALYIIFNYVPMYGVQIAFRNYKAKAGILGSPWVGLKHFQRFFRSYYAQRLVFNTLGIGVYSLAVGFPIPIILAIMMNELRSLRYKKFIQTVTYLPHFLSTVVLVSIVNAFLNPKTGLVNMFFLHMGRPTIYFMAEPQYFKTIYVLSGVWQNMGWDSIIYVAALAGIDPTFYEAGRVDGATRWQMLLHITLPSILPTATIMLILRCGHIMGVGFEKVFLMQNDLNMSTSDVISTYVYRSGLINAEFSFSAAVGLFNSVVNCVMLVIVNWITGRLGGTQIF